VGHVEEKIGLAGPATARHAAGGEGLAQMCHDRLAYLNRGSRIGEACLRRDDF
jgi:hypothetical protein